MVYMKLKKRKIKYAAIFCLCWFVFLIILVDGVLKFQTLVDYFGSYALVEIMLHVPDNLSRKPSQVPIHPLSSH